MHGGNGAALADEVRRRFPVAMIDEFQDTDPVQYGIFRELYRDRPDCGLIMIGDPKQAIYSFRGGDIFTYMQAREDVGEAGIYTLGVNWRSTPPVLRAVNAVFEQRAVNAFVYGETIPYLALRAADKPHRHLERGGKRQAALQLWLLPEGRNAKDEPKPLSKEEAARLSHAAVAQEIARLIAEGSGRRRRGSVTARCARAISRCWCARPTRPRVCARCSRRTASMPSPSVATVSLILRRRSPWSHCLPPSSNRASGNSCAWR